MQFTYERKKIKPCSKWFLESLTDVLFIYLFIYSFIFAFLTKTIAEGYCLQRIKLIFRICHIGKIPKHFPPVLITSAWCNDEIIEVLSFF